MTVRAWMLLALTALASLSPAAAGAEPSRHVALPTGASITLPAPGFVGRTNSFPATIALSPDGGYAALLNQGYGTRESGLMQSIAVLDLKTNRLEDFPDVRLRADEKATLQSYFVGLAFSGDGRHLYASLASVSRSEIAVYLFASGRITPERVIPVPAQPLPKSKVLTYAARANAAGTVPAYVAGLAVLSSPMGDRLLVASNLADSVLVLDAASGQVVHSFDLSPQSRFVPAAYPFTVIANRVGTRAWVSLWNDSAVMELDLVSGRIARRIELSRPQGPVAPSAHPTAMKLDAREEVLYVAVSNAAASETDGIAAVDLKSGAVARTYVVALDTHEAPGASPLGIALSPDGSRLFAASASLDAVAVFAVDDAGRPAAATKVSPIGFVPTEWYPSALAMAGDDLLIATAKGEGAGPNNMDATVQSGIHHERHPYIPTLIGGSLQRLSLSQIEQNLPAFTRQVAEDDLQLSPASNIRFVGGRDPIRHVIYVLKENRTYDQIFGDLPVGDGDAALTMYGADVTPNEHKLALQFGVLDNFYDSGEVSANGHLWSDGAATSDYIEKIWPVIYRGSERPSDYGNPLEQGLADADDPGTGFIWDDLAAHDFSYRIYGEMVATTWCHDQKMASPREGTPSEASAACPAPYVKLGEPFPAAGIGAPAGAVSAWPWPVPLFKNVRALKAAQRDHIDPLYPDFAVDYPDQFRANEFLREFTGFVSGRGTAKGLPQFVEVWLPNDHTSGTRVGKPTPRASVADNDLALGRLVDAVSHSPYWGDTAIFVVEDDAQDGADHVDAHRSIALVISKYAPDRTFVDHHFYTTVGMVHTMEMLIGLPPMNFFDSHAPVFAPLFAGPGTQPAFQADDRNLRNGLLYRINGKRAPGAKRSARLDFSRPDVADATILNAILWQDAKSAVK